jgi:hypothetical protein
MNDFADYDPSMWRDDSQEFATWLDDSQVMVQSRPSTWKQHLVAKVAAVLVAAGALTGACFTFRQQSASAQGMAWVTPTSVMQTSSPGQASVPAHDSGPTSMFSDKAKSESWQAAMELLRSAGEDVPALLQSALNNVSMYGHGEHEFPAHFPEDEC